MPTPSFLLVVGLCLCTLVEGRAQPTITRQPQDFSISVGAGVTNQVTASGTIPLRYQWLREGIEILGETNRTLILTNIQLIHAGNYTAIVSDTIGSTNSRAATLEVDPTFTKITSGPIVTDLGTFWGGSWGDFDGDGNIDLFVPRNDRQGNRLYRSNGDGTFAAATTNEAGPVLGDRGNSLGASWADYDNDGDLDLFVANGGAEPNTELNFFYERADTGSFIRVGAAKGTFASDRGKSNSPVWGDYNNDGWVDLFVPNFDAPAFLYRGLGDGKFERASLSPLTTGIGFSVAAAWGDYDNDGDLDLFVANVDLKNFLYRNNGDGTFTRITEGPVANDAVWAFSGMWGDYDNDGFLDLFVANWNNNRNALYHNERNGTFTKVTTGEIVSEPGYSVFGSWGDYDNDGWLDLFVANAAPSNRKNYLFHNNGDGTFTKVRSGSPSNEGQQNAGCAWADYNRDGFLDLFVSGGANETGSNFLYRNNGNSNHWIQVRLVGTRSNRSAIGAKVRVKATMNGKSFWQVREISGGQGHGGGQDSLEAEFGLGNAITIETVRIEWPSGQVQELHNIPTKQFLTVTEPTRLGVTGAGAFRITSWLGQQFDIEASANLVTWMRVMTLTNQTGTLTFSDPEALVLPARFYRVQQK